MGDHSASVLMDVFILFLDIMGGVPQGSVSEVESRVAHDFTKCG